MAKQISDELYQAYLDWIALEKRAHSLHNAYEQLAIKHVGEDKWDPLESGKLIVELCRKRLAEENKDAG